MLGEKHLFEHDEVAWDAQWEEKALKVSEELAKDCPGMLTERSCAGSTLGAAVEQGLPIGRSETV